jgi:uncharacterized damage-inducible protein DinB
LIEDHRKDYLFRLVNKVVPRRINMNDCQSSLDTIYAGWCRHQELLIAALEPLTTHQLSLRAAPLLRSTGELTAHIIATRARWFAPPLGDGSRQLAAYAHWDKPDDPHRGAHDLVRGLQFTQDYIQITMACWTPEEWNISIPGNDDHEPAVVTRQWVIWHIIEHDLHHGGEISLSLGVHQLAPPDMDLEFT